MNTDYYSYKGEKFSCNHCGWTGTGKEVEEGEMFEDGFEVDCPNCHEHFPGLIMFPMIEEVLEKGSKKDKLAALAMKTHREKWLASLLKSTNQLPDLHDDIMIFELKELEDNGENYIIITYNGLVVWKEIRVYEYYDRFIEIGKLFKEKYGKRMVDLVPEVDGLYLYGDSCSSVQLIDEFRAELRSNG